MSRVITILSLESSWNFTTNFVLRIFVSRFSAELCELTHITLEEKASRDTIRSILNLRYEYKIYEYLNIRMLKVQLQQPFIDSGNK